MDLMITQWVLALIIINTLVLSFATCFPVFTNPYPKTKLSQLFYFSGHLSQMFIFSIILSLIFTIIAMLTKNPYVFIPISSTLCMLFLFFLIANSVTYSKYRFNINKTIFELVFNKGARQVVQPSKKEIFIFISGILISFIICSGLQTLIWIWAAHHFDKILIYSMIIILFTLYLLNQFIYSICSYLGYMPVLQYTVKIFGYDALSLYRLVHKLGISLINPRNRLIHALKNSQKNTRTLKYPLHPIKTHPPENPPNVLLIVIDSWRFDMLNDIVTPNLYQFSKNANVFGNHWSSGNTTQPGLFGLFYGIPPTYWAATKKQKKPSLLVQTLKEHHYQMEILASANLLNPPFNQTIFCCIENLRAFTPGKTPLERDKNISQDMVKFINNYDKKNPFFGFLFYDSAHGYYAIPELPKQFTPVMEMNHIMTSNSTDPEPIFNLYKNALYAIDQSLKEVFMALKNSNLLDNTIVVITGDHGQEFNDFKKNYWEHPSNFGKYQTKVPLIVKHPFHQPKKIDYLTTHYDVAPTLLEDVMGVSNPPPDYSIGNHLYRNEGRYPFVIVNNYTNAGIVNDHHITNIQRDGHYQITDTELNQLELAKPDIDHLKQVIELFNRYYQH